MKIGVFTALFADMSLDEVLDYVSKVGLEALELGTGNYPGAAHINVKELLASDQKIKEYKTKIKDKGLEISALSCHGNPLHPDKDIADDHHNIHRDTVLLASKMGIDTVINFSGCPGGSEKDKYPNWVTCPWPDDFSEIVKWQWEEKVIPYWKQEAKFADDHGIKLAFEMHPGFVVYNTESMIRLRESCGKNIGANFDPSHLFWQGMDPIMSLKELEGAVFHVHAKDCRVDLYNTSINGVLDIKSYGDEKHRSWIFRTVGYGHSEDFWRDFVSTLRLIGYDGVLSIEHEDSLMSSDEGLKKAVQFLKGIVLKEKPGAMFWA
ncbi:sugar phosphate isomerase/epimerase family protein [candidate division KSB1 bacterium]